MAENMRIVNHLVPATSRANMPEPAVRSATEKTQSNQLSDVVLAREQQEKLDNITHELAEIKAILYGQSPSEKDIEEALSKYSRLMNKENIDFLDRTDRNLSAKALYIHSRIHDFEVSKDLMTHEYYQEQLHILTTYSYDVGMKYHREGMSGYMAFYKKLTTVLNDYGSYLGDVVDEGKKTQLKEHKLINDICNIMREYIPDIEKDTGFSYKSNIDVVQGSRDGLYNVVVDGEITESDISYQSAVKAMDGFFSVFKNPVNGTHFIKQIIPERDEKGNVIKLTGKLRQFVLPAGLMKYLNMSNYGAGHTSDVNGSLDIIRNKNIFTDGNIATRIESDNKSENSLLTNKIKSSIDNSLLNKENNYITVYQKINYNYNGWKVRVDVSYTEVSKTEYENNKNKEVFVAGWAKHKPLYTTTIKKVNDDTVVNVDNNTLNILSTRIDGVKKETQMTLDEFSQHYSTKNSNYENMVKNITNMINDLFNEIKNLLRI